MERCDMEVKYEKSPGVPVRYGSGTITDPYSAFLVPGYSLILPKCLTIFFYDTAAGQPRLNMKIQVVYATEAVG